MCDKPLHLLFTAEHAGNDVPADYRHLFQGADGVLRSHRGWDPGALHLGRRLAEHFDAPLIATTVTRLLVDCNRSPHHPRVFSEFTKPLPRAERRALLAAHHTPHRDAVRNAVAKLATQGAVLHIGVHSFTPVLNGEVRNADIGLLYDPAQRREASLCRAWQERITDLRVRRNYPYRGVADGLVTTLREAFDTRMYVGVELEVNQKFVDDDGRSDAALSGVVAESLAATLQR